MSLVSRQRRYRIASTTECAIRPDGGDCLMPYDFDRYAKELVQLVQLSSRPGWNPESAARMYLQHAYTQGQREAFAAMLQQVDESLADVQP